MSVRKDGGARVLISGAAMLVLLGLVLAAVLKFDVLGDASGREGLLTRVLPLLLIALTGVLLALNFMYFNKKMGGAHPGLARSIPACFAFGGAILLLVGKHLFGYAPSRQEVVLLFVVSTAAWTVVNLAVHFFLKRRAT